MEITKADFRRRFSASFKVIPNYMSLVNLVAYVVRRLRPTVTRAAVVAEVWSLIADC